MIEDGFAMFPASQREKARSALLAAFGSAPIDAITPVMGGVSGASVFRVEVARHRYLVRIEGHPGPLRNPHQYVSMRIAAEAGIAPRIHYIDEQACVAVMDFVEAQPLSAYPGGAHGLAQALGELLVRVQATRPFPRFVEYPEIVSRLWAHVCHTGLFAPGVLDAHTERLARIREAYGSNPEKLVSSHNDVLPRNVLFDGKRLWLIDWESAYRSDPLVDVATALDNFAPSQRLEEVLLQAWLGRAADQKLRDRLAQVRALTRLYYAGVLFSASAKELRSTPDTDLSAPTLGELQQALRDGRLTPDALEARHVLGKMYLASFLSGAAAPGLPPPFSHFQVKSLRSAPAVAEQATAAANKPESTWLG